MEAMYLVPRMIRAVAAIAAVVAFGTVGFVTVEGWSVADALYMTVVTITTVGYDEVRPLSSGGRIFNIFVMVGGVGVVLYVLSASVQTVVESHFLTNFVRRRRMNARIANMSDHVILCGYGRVGNEVARALSVEQEELIVVENTEEQIEVAGGLGLPYVLGDATKNDSLLAAGIERAKVLIAALGSDSDNLFITLTARTIRPEITVVARATALESVEKLEMAGADKVVAPFAVGGRRLALSAVRPRAIDLFDTILTATGDGPRLAEIQVEENSPMARATVETIAATNGIQVLALSRIGDGLTVTPNGDTTVEPGDALVVVGPDANLTALEGKE